MQRRIDALISEFIFGFDAHCNPDGRWVCQMDSGEHTAIPRYSTNLTIAMEIVYYLRPTFDQVILVFDGADTCSFDDTTASAETMAMAICLAALQTENINYLEEEL